MHNYYALKTLFGRAVYHLACTTIACHSTRSGGGWKLIFSDGEQHQ